MQVIADARRHRDLADEGRAMAQIVHDLAPDARLLLRRGFDGTLSFTNSIAALTNAGANVIVDDLLYLDEPFFQDGPIANAVTAATASGVSFFSAAGNSNEVVAGFGAWVPGRRPSSGTPCPATASASRRSAPATPAWTSIPEPAPTTTWPSRGRRRDDHARPAMGPAVSSA